MLYPIQYSSEQIEGGYKRRASVRKWHFKILTSIFLFYIEILWEL